ncbi:MAG: SDR family oxidoreductase [Pseudomonadota bacterium]
MKSEKSSFSTRFGGAALITGASSGFGEAFVRALAARKMDVILVARRENLLRKLAKEIEQEHEVKSLVIAADLTAQDAIPRIKNTVDQAGLSVGLLVNNAGFGTYGPFAKQDPVKEANMVDLNCRAPVLLTHAFLPQMLERKKGGIIFVASMAGFQPTIFLATYAATKAFDLILAEALWAELKPKGIDVLGLCPGYVVTGFQDAADAQRMPPRGSKVTPEKVVEVALKNLGKKPSVVPGNLNKIMVGSGRFAPRRIIAKVAGRFIAPQKKQK